MCEHLGAYKDVVNPYTFPMPPKSAENEPSIRFLLLLTQGPAGRVPGKLKWEYLVGVLGPQFTVCKTEGQPKKQGLAEMPNHKPEDHPSELA